MSCDAKKNNFYINIVGSTSKDRIPIAGNEISITTQEFPDRIEDTINYSPYLPLVISTFENNVNLARKGSTISAVDLTWTLNKAIQSQRIESSAFTTINPTVNGGTSYTENLTGLTITSDTTINLFVDDVTADVNAEKTKSTSITFGNDVLVGKLSGVSASTSIAALEAHIPNLTKHLKTSNSLTYTCTGLTPSERDLYYVPQSFPDPKFLFSGNITYGGYIKINSVSYTNADGFTENYDVWMTVAGHLDGAVVTISN